VLNSEPPKTGPESTVESLEHCPAAANLTLENSAHCEPTANLTLQSISAHCEPTHQLTLENVKEHTQVTLQNISERTAFSVSSHGSFGDAASAKRAIYGATKDNVSITKDSSKDSDKPSTLPVKLDINGISGKKDMNGKTIDGKTINGNTIHGNFKFINVSVNGINGNIDSINGKKESRDGDLKGDLEDHGTITVTGKLRSFGSFKVEKDGDLNDGTAKFRTLKVEKDGDLSDGTGKFRTCRVDKDGDLSDGTGKFRSQVKDETHVASKKDQTHAGTKDQTHVGTKDQTHVGTKDQTHAGTKDQTAHEATCKPKVTQNEATEPVTPSEPATPGKRVQFQTSNPAKGATAKGASSIPAKGVQSSIPAKGVQSGIPAKGIQTSQAPGAGPTLSTAKSSSSDSLAKKNSISTAQSSTAKSSSTSTSRSFSESVTEKKSFETLTEKRDRESQEDRQNRSNRSIVTDSISHRGNYRVYHVRDISRDVAENLWKLARAQEEARMSLSMRGYSLFPDADLMRGEDDDAEIGRGSEMFNSTCSSACSSMNTRSSMNSASSPDVSFSATLPARFRMSGFSASGGPEYTLQQCAANTSAASTYNSTGTCPPNLTSSASCGATYPPPRERRGSMSEVPSLLHKSSSVTSESWAPQARSTVTSSAPRCPSSYVTSSAPPRGGPSVNTKTSYTKTSNYHTASGPTNPVLHALRDRWADCQDDLWQESMHTPKSIWFDSSDDSPCPHYASYCAKKLNSNAKNAKSPNEKGKESNRSTDRSIDRENRETKLQIYYRNLDRDIITALADLKKSLQSSDSMRDAFLEAELFPNPMHLVSDFSEESSNSYGRNGASSEQYRNGWGEPVPVGYNKSTGQYKRNYNLKKGSKSRLRTNSFHMQNSFEEKGPQKNAALTRKFGKDLRNNNTLDVRIANVEGPIQETFGEKDFLEDVSDLNSSGKGKPGEGDLGGNSSKKLNWSPLKSPLKMIRSIIGSSDSSNPEDSNDSSKLSSKLKSAKLKSDTAADDDDDDDDLLSSKKKSESASDKLGVNASVLSSKKKFSGLSNLSSKVKSGISKKGNSPSKKGKQGEMLTSAPVKSPKSQTPQKRKYLSSKRLFGGFRSFAEWKLQMPSSAFEATPNGVISLEIVQGLGLLNRISREAFLLHKSFFTVGDVLSSLNPFSEHNRNKSYEMIDGIQNWKRVVVLSSMKIEVFSEYHPGGPEANPGVPRRFSRRSPHPGRIVISVPRNNVVSADYASLKPIVTSSRNMSVSSSSRGKTESSNHGANTLQIRNNRIFKSQIEKLFHTFFGVADAEEKMSNSDRDEFDHNEDEAHYDESVGERGLSDSEGSDSDSEPDNYVEKNLVNSRKESDPDLNRVSGKDPDLNRESQEQFVESSSKNLQNDETQQQKLAEQNIKEFEAGTANSNEFILSAGEVLDGITELISILEEYYISDSGRALHKISDIESNPSDSERHDEKNHDGHSDRHHEKNHHEKNLEDAIHKLGAHFTRDHHRKPLSYLESLGLTHRVKENFPTDFSSAEGSSQGETRQAAPHDRFFSSSITKLSSTHSLIFATNNDNHGLHDSDSPCRSDHGYFAGGGFGSPRDYAGGFGKDPREASEQCSQHSPSGQSHSGSQKPSNKMILAVLISHKSDDVTITTRKVSTKVDKKSDNNNSSRSNSRANSRSNSRSNSPQNANRMNPNRMKKKSLMRSTSAGAFFFGKEFHPHFPDLPHLPHLPKEFPHLPKEFHPHLPHFPGSKHFPGNKRSHIPLPTLPERSKSAGAVTFGRNLSSILEGRDPDPLESRDAEEPLVMKQSDADADHPTIRTKDNDMCPAEPASRLDGKSLAPHAPQCQSLKTLSIEGPSDAESSAKEIESVKEINSVKEMCLPAKSHDALDAPAESDIRIIEPPPQERMFRPPRPMEAPSSHPKRVIVQEQPPPTEEILHSSPNTSANLNTTNTNTGNMNTANMNTAKNVNTGNMDTANMDMADMNTGNMATMLSYEFHSESSDLDHQTTPMIHWDEIRNKSDSLGQRFSDRWGWGDDQNTDMILRVNSAEFKKKINEMAKSEFIGFGDLLPEKSPEKQESCQQKHDSPDLCQQKEGQKDSPGGFPTKSSTKRRSSILPESLTKFGHFGDRRSSSPFVSSTQEANACSQKEKAEKAAKERAAEEKAATEIQTAVRGRAARKRVARKRAAATRRGSIDVLMGTLTDTIDTFTDTVDTFLDSTGLRSSNQQKQQKSKTIPLIFRKHLQELRDFEAQILGKKPKEIVWYKKLAVSGKLRIGESLGLGHGLGTKDTRMNKRVKILAKQISNLSQMSNISDLANANDVNEECSVLSIGSQSDAHVCALSGTPEVEVHDSKKVEVHDSEKKDSSSVKAASKKLKEAFKVASPRKNPFQKNPFDFQSWQGMATQTNKKFAGLSAFMGKSTSSKSLSSKSLSSKSLSSKSLSQAVNFKSKSLSQAAKLFSAATLSDKFKFKLHRKRDRDDSMAESSKKSLTSESSKKSLNSESSYLPYNDEDSNLTQTAEFSSRRVSIRSSSSVSQNYLGGDPQDEFINILIHTILLRNWDNSPFLEISWAEEEKTTAEPVKTQLNEAGQRIERQQWTAEGTAQGAQRTAAESFDGAFVNNGNPQSGFVNPNRSAFVNNIVKIRKITDFDAKKSVRKESVRKESARKESTPNRKESVRMPNKKESVREAKKSVRNESMTMSKDPVSKSKQSASKSKQSASKSKQSVSKSKQSKRMAQLSKIMAPPTRMAQPRRGRMGLRSTMRRGSTTSSVGSATRKQVKNLKNVKLWKSEKTCRSSDFDDRSSTFTEC